MKDEREVERKRGAGRAGKGGNISVARCGTVSACAGIPCTSKVCLKSSLVCLRPAQGICQSCLCCLLLFFNYASLKICNLDNLFRQPLRASFALCVFLFFSLFQVSAIWQIMCQKFVEYYDKSEWSIIYKLCRYIVNMRWRQIFKWEVNKYRISKNWNTLSSVNYTKSIRFIDAFRLSFKFTTLENLSQRYVPQKGK